MIVLCFILIVKQVDQSKFENYSSKVLFMHLISIKIFNLKRFTIILTNPMKNVTSLILIFALGTKFLQETYDLYKLKNWAHGSNPAWYYLWINQDITNANRASLKTWALSFWHFPQFFSQKSKQLCNYFRFLFFIVM